MEGNMADASSKDKGNAEKQDKDAFQFQLDFLKIEVEIIDKAIARLDEITQTTKNWAILIWSGSMAVALGQADLQPYIIYTAVIPLLFWTVDARWRFYLRGFIFRDDKIAEFLNGENLQESFKQRKIIGMSLFDPRGFQYRKTKEYKEKVNMWRSLKYPEVSTFYLGMSLMSLAVGLFFILKP
jgi:hypothetical protein